MTSPFNIPSEMTQRRENSLFCKRKRFLSLKIPVLCYTKLAILNFEVVLMYSIEVLSNDGHPQKK